MGWGHAAADAPLAPIRAGIRTACKYSSLSALLTLRAFRDGWCSGTARFLGNPEDDPRCSTLSAFVVGAVCFCPVRVRGTPRRFRVAFRRCADLSVLVWALAGRVLHGVGGGFARGPPDGGARRLRQGPPRRVPRRCGFPTSCGAWSSGGARWTRAGCPPGRVELGGLAFPGCRVLLRDVSLPGALPGGVPVLRRALPRHAPRCVDRGGSRRRVVVPTPISVLESRRFPHARLRLNDRRD